eukprot:2841207-Pleurochrysis_carterae.AAC.1
MRQARRPHARSHALTHAHALAHAHAHAHAHRPACTHTQMRAHERGHERVGSHRQRRTQAGSLTNREDGGEVNVTSIGFSRSLPRPPIHHVPPSLTFLVLLHPSLSPPRFLLFGLLFSLSFCVAAVMTSAPQFPQLQSISSIRFECLLACGPAA